MVVCLTPISQGARIRSNGHAVVGETVAYPRGNHKGLELSLLSICPFVIVSVSRISKTLNELMALHEASSYTGNIGLVAPNEKWLSVTVQLPSDISGTD
ncbi:hypothetical protein J6590_039586 [Homalodisca vitripennis]|nr:hypothetical protein J6590_039586 [Homalodisca vitripennis]